jgi:two-component system, chemotaxis family, protein-glutamate methylesterase/glutaminase
MVAWKFVRFVRARVSSNKSSLKKPRVLVVDDSAFMRRMTSQIIDGSGEFTVIGTARNGYDALKQIHTLDPDLVTLDVDMPELDGLNALGYIMSEMPRPVVMLSAGTTGSGQAATLRALELGAVDFVCKPSGSISLDLRLISDQLLGALRAAMQTNVAALRMMPRVAIEAGEPSTPSHDGATSAVVIASSTGGPRALPAVLPRLPRTFGAAVLVVQHMPATFTKSLAQRLDVISPLEIDEAEDGELVIQGRVYVAPGGHHMTVRSTSTGPRIALDQSPPVWGVRPAADNLFRSAAEVFGASTLAVVLTGMGRDGAEGTRAIRAAGGQAIAQDRETSTIFSMPQAAIDIGGAEVVLPLTAIGSGIVERIEAVRHVP